MYESVEEIEWGLRRKPLYERQRDAIKEMEDKKEIKATKVMGLFGFVALTGAAIMNLVFYPSFASSGFNTIL